MAVRSLPRGPSEPLAAERFDFSIYDGLIVASALEAGCGVLYTEDMQHGQKIEELVINNPFGSF